jgi:hypothetical protein
MDEIVKDLIKEGLDAKMVKYPSAKTPYIRIGYWKQIPNDLFEKFKFALREEELFDEDCGYLYTYYLR